MKWIMVANSNDCKIFKYDRNIHKLSLVEEISHPENRLREHDLVTDCYGAYQNIGVHGGTYEPEKTHTQLAMDKFARELADKLNIGRMKKRYDSVILMMPATMGGMLFKHLNKHVLTLVKKVIQKNFMHLSDHELKDLLGDELRYVGLLH